MPKPISCVVKLGSVRIFFIYQISTDFAYDGITMVSHDDVRLEQARCRSALRCRLSGRK